MHGTARVLGGRVHASYRSIKLLADLNHDAGDVRRIGIELGADGGGNDCETRDTAGKFQRLRVGLHQAVKRADETLTVVGSF
jgi:hypothetical protein